jgi:hypothetical protein
MNSSGIKIMNDFQRVCAKAVAEHLNIPFDNISSCIAKSFENYENFRLSENTIFKKNKEEIERFKLNHFTSLPHIVINKVPFKVRKSNFREKEMDLIYLRQFAQVL